jgi:hypothetical protein
VQRAVEVGFFFFFFFFFSPFFFTLHCTLLTPMCFFSSRRHRTPDLCKPTLITPTSDCGVVAAVEHKPDIANSALLRHHVTNDSEHRAVWAADAFANDHHLDDTTNTTTNTTNTTTSSSRTPRRVNVVHLPDCAHRRVCLGCSPQWRALQLAPAPDLIRAWGPSDLLRFDPLHGATASVEVARANGDFVPFTIEPFECDLVHTLVAGPPDALCLWFFVSPEQGAKLRRLLAGAGPLFGEPSAIVTLDALAAHGIEVQTAAQPLHHTVVVPPGWLSCRVYCGGADGGAPLDAVGVHWRLLRAPSLAGALRVAPPQRLYGSAFSLSLVGLAVAAASEKLDFLEQMRVQAAVALREDAQRDRRSALAVLKHILPALQSEVLEVVLQEAVGVSSLTALAYEPALASIAAGLPAPLQLGMKVAGTAEKPRRSIGADATLDPYDACESCNVALFNGRRVCDTCSAAMCASCYGAFGHKHPMQLRRRIDTETLKRLARAVSVAVGVAGAGLEFINKKDVLQIDATATLVGDASLADMPLSSFTLSVQPKRRRKMAPAVSQRATPNYMATDGKEWATGALPHQYQQINHQQQPQQQQQQQNSQQQQQQQQSQTGVASDDDNSGGNTNNGHKFNSNNNSNNNMDEDDDEDDRIDCICGRNDDRGFMLFCDRCRVWLHGKCVNITKKTVPEVFVCPRCIK